MDIDQAKEYLIQYHKAEYSRYIEFVLAGDFAVVLAEDHEQILHMRKLMEDTVYKNFERGLQELCRLGIDTPLSKYLEPFNDMDWEERKEWVTEPKLKHIKKLLGLLSNEQLLACLTEQHCEQFR